jgi:glycosyltransferase involved in cell wall biosynthesis
MTKPVTFLMILNDLDWFWSHRLPLAHAIQAKGWTLHLATARAPQDPEIIQKNIIPHDIAAHGHSLNPLSHIKIVWGIAQVIRRVKPDILHAITLRHALYAGLAARLSPSCPVVFTIAGLGTLFTHDDLRSRLLRAMVLPVLKLAFARQDARIIFQNPDDQRAFLNLKIVRPEQTAIIRGSGVDITAFAFTPEPSLTPPRILFPSRLLKEKGIFDFVAAAQIIKQKGIAAVFQMAGSVYPGNPHSVSNTDIDGWVKDGIIEYLGNCRDMPRVISDSTLVVLPSYYGEGVPKVLLEAGAIGRPVITCDMPGCREAVRDGYNGLLVSPKNPEVLAQAIETLLSDSETRARMGKAGREHVESDFTAEIVTKKTLKVYEDLI